MFKSDKKDASIYNLQMYTKKSYSQIINNFLRKNITTKQIIINKQNIYKMTNSMK